eukprot:TRINITY_DN35337_c0_g1_i2.p1 TRINITY_DN35337_c0_g1~~TRINITY_DN35337_c0_g1_i2.p1  ORF type:complete len:283 (+),score=38.66 TRINITY_DN35337_c0_g1_i2:63-851(+)
MSRFAMRHLFAFLPTEFEGLLKVLTSKLNLPEDCGLDANFVTSFNSHVEAALREQEPYWIDHLELQRAPAWFLCQCLPVAGLLRRAAAAVADKGSLASEEEKSNPASKRIRTCYGTNGMSGTADSVRQVLLSGLSEAELLVLLALFRQQDRAPRRVRTLSTVLYELNGLIEQCGGVLSSHREEVFVAAFHRLLGQQLVRLNVTSGQGSEMPKRYLPCESLVDSTFGVFVQDLERAEPDEDSAKNPLRSLPQQVQQWAKRVRR